VGGAKFTELGQLGSSVHEICNTAFALSVKSRNRFVTKKKKDIFGLGNRI
jgi:hypothetical protein